MIRFSSDIKKLSDEVLLLKYFEEGDMASLGELYNRYIHLVFGLSLKYLKNREDAKDASMLVFERLVKALKTQKVTHFKSWLYMVTKNHCLMQLRKSKPENLELNDAIMEIEFDRHPNTEEPIDRDLISLEKCMEKLNGEQAKCVRLFYLENNSYQEICDETMIALNKVKSYIQNGRRNLKLCIEQNGKKQGTY